MAQLVRIFEPGRIGSMDLKNRLVMSPMGTHTADEEGYITQRTIDYYVERAKGGVGFIISQGTCFLAEARAHHRSWLHDDKFIPKLKELADAVHQHDCKMAIQLMHHGNRLSEHRHHLSHPEEIDLVGPSPVPWVGSGVAPREASKKDINHIVEGFAEAARRVKEAGFDAVEFHGAHGYLIHEFLSPFTNKRNDEYGGTPEKRARFACEILACAREKVGWDFPISFRMSASDFLEGGISIEEAMRQAPLFVEAGADALNVSASAKDSTQWQFLSYLFPSGAIAHLAQAIRKAVKVPVIAVGKIGDPLLAERTLQEGKADFIAMGRAFLADPYLPNKAKEGRLEDINYCLYCNNCRPRVLGVRRDGNQCAVNPALFREREFVIKPASPPKKVMVIGAGLAGMEAARVLAERGHQVSLYEKGDREGGLWNIVVRQEGKEDWSRLTERMARGLVKAGVKVTLNTAVTPRMVQEIKPDAVVVAIGATPRSLEVPGSDGKNVVQAVDVLMGKAEVGDRVVVVGARYVGMETALFLAEQGKHVYLVERYELGPGLELDIYKTLRDRLIEHGVQFFPHSPVLEIKENGVYVADGRHLLFLKADTVVLAVGLKPQNTLAEEIKSTVTEVYTIGDCVEPRDALFAIHEGAEVGRKI